MLKKSQKAPLSDEICLKDVPPPNTGLATVVCNELKWGYSDITDTIFKVIELYKVRSFKKKRKPEPEKKNCIMGFLDLPVEYLTCLLNT